MTFATQITLFRFLLIPVFVGFLLYYEKSAAEGLIQEGYRWGAVVTFLVAAVSDALDGFCARVFKQRSHLGAMLDPLADKALLVSGLLVLSLISVEGFESLPIWFVVLVLGRDAILVGGFICLHTLIRHIKVKPHWTGKASTVFQMTAIGVVLLKIHFIPLFWVVIVAGAFTVISMGIYFMRGIRAINESGYGHPGSSP
jgi:CDP-diacylglycerol--glycerol-3-phosphate 3-phosphatidyltransferase/cardiolipin synthase